MWWASPGDLVVAARERQALAGRELDDVLAQRADAQLRPGQVLQDRDRAPGAAGGVAHAADRLGVLLERAVRVVQPRDVHARLDHAHERLRLARGGADRGDDLRAAHARKVAVQPRPLPARGRARRLASGRARSLPTASPRRRRARIAHFGGGFEPATMVAVERGRPAAAGARRGRRAARVRAQPRHRAVRLRRRAPRAAPGAARAPAERARAAVLQAPAPAASGKCSAQCSRSTSRTHARSSAEAMRKRAEQLALALDRRARDHPAHGQPLEQQLERPLPGVLLRARAPRSPAPASACAYSLRGAGRERAAQRQHVAVGVGVVAARRARSLGWRRARLPTLRPRRRPVRAARARRR